MSQALHAHHKHQQTYRTVQNHRNSNYLIQYNFDPPISCWLEPQPLKTHHSNASLSLCTTRAHPAYHQNPNHCVYIDPNVTENTLSNSSSTTILTSMMNPLQNTIARINYYWIKKKKRFSNKSSHQLQFCKGWIKLASIVKFLILLLFKFK